MCAREGRCSLPQARPPLRPKIGARPTLSAPPWPNPVRMTGAARNSHTVTPAPSSSLRDPGRGALEQGVQGGLWGRGNPGNLETMPQKVHWSGSSGSQPVARPVTAPAALPTLAGSWTVSLPRPRV